MNDQQNEDYSIRALALEHASRLSGAAATAPTRGVVDILADAAKIEDYLRNGAPATDA